MTRIGILGCAGRMGRMLLQEVLGRQGAKLAGGVETPGNPLIGKDLGALIGQEPTGLLVGDDSAALFAASEVVIDFTHPSALAGHAELAARQGCALVVGTTGLEERHLAALRNAAQRSVIVRSANMSLGVTLLSAMVRQAAARLGPEMFDIEILEMHHHHKIDAPSGTALALGEAAAQGRGVALDQVWRKSRDGEVGARPVGEIGFATLRGGDVVGDHTVMFAAEGERIELTHKASSRLIFARGAVSAALWCKDRKPGFYAMSDVLGL